KSPIPNRLVAAADVCLTSYRRQKCMICPNGTCGVQGFPQRRERQRDQSGRTAWHAAVRHRSRPSNSAERQGLRQQLRRPGGAGNPLLHFPARTGGYGQSPGLNWEPSNFWTPAIRWDRSQLTSRSRPRVREDFTEKTSLFFKATRIYLLPDKKHNI